MSFSASQWTRDINQIKRIINMRKAFAFALAAMPFVVSVATPAFAQTSVEERVKSVVAEQLGLGHEINNDDTLLELGADGLDCVYLHAEIEEEFETELSEEDTGIDCFAYEDRSATPEDTVQVFIDAVYYSLGD